MAHRRWRPQLGEHHRWSDRDRFGWRGGSGRVGPERDLPGHGRSEGAVVDSIEGMADWVISVLDTTKQDKTIIVGHSMGSLVAFDLAARYPDRVDTLVMVGTSIPMPVGDVLLDSAKDDLDVAKEMVNFWSHSQAAHLGGSQVPGTWMIGKLQRLLERSGPGVIYNDLKACADYTSGIERSKDIACPTLLILGEDDFMTPVRNSKSLVANISKSVDSISFIGKS